MTDPGSNQRNAPDDARLDALLDAFFDKELSIDDSAMLFKGLRSSPKKAREFGATRRALEGLKDVDPAPDLADEILSAVDRQRPWLRDRDVWGVRLGRAGLVAALLLALGGTLMHRRATPDAQIWNPAPAPVTDLVRSSGEATSLTRENAQAAMVSLRNEATRFVPSRSMQATAGLAAFKPGVPDPEAGGEVYAVSFKPTDAGSPSRRSRGMAATGFGVASRSEGDLIILRLVPGDEPGEGGSTVVTFRPR